jgi:hypothetical protein
MAKTEIRTLAMSLLAARDAYRAAVLALDDAEEGLVAATKMNEALDALEAVLHKHGFPASIGIRGGR